MMLILGMILLQADAVSTGVVKANLRYPERTIAEVLSGVVPDRRKGGYYLDDLGVAVFPAYHAILGDPTTTELELQEIAKHIVRSKFDVAEFRPEALLLLNGRSSVEVDCGLRMLTKCGLPQDADKLIGLLQSKKTQRHKVFTTYISFADRDCLGPVDDLYPCCE